MYSSDVAKPRFTMVYEYSSRNALFNARMLKFTGERLHWLINAPEKTVFQNKKDLSFNHYAYVVNYCAIKSASEKLQDYHDFDVVSYLCDHKRSKSVKKPFSKTICTLSWSENRFSIWRLGEKLHKFKVKSMLLLFNLTSHDMSRFILRNVNYYCTI